MFNIIKIRIICFILSWGFIIINAILRDNEESKQEAEKVKFIYGEKRVNLLNIYMLFLLPEFICICVILKDLKIIFGGGKIDK